MTYTGTPGFYAVFSSRNPDEDLERVRLMLVDGCGAWFAHYILSGDVSSDDAVPEHEDAVSVQATAQEPFVPQLPETRLLDAASYSVLEKAGLVHEYAFSDGPYDRYAVLARAYYNLASKH